MTMRSFRLSVVLGSILAGVACGAGSGGCGGSIGVGGDSSAPAAAGCAGSATTTSWVAEVIGTL